MTFINSLVLLIVTSDIDTAAATVPMKTLIVVTTESFGVSLTVLSSPHAVSLLTYSVFPSGLPNAPLDAPAVRILL
ncbi:hypothetical protein AVEN_238735-1 [Araneus ventricosus]|uniref:Secreted protein n=1 Tax=Araneus ventricosus TaxID=182803 RepID=A0A4Y2GJP7_ARAVE|nr:hypothetical protein AVEN_238735-1 [Araneus ventricosus]